MQTPTAFALTRIAHLSDLHLGYAQLNRQAANGQNQREADFERAALVAVDHIINVVKPDICIIAGDLLHDTRVSNTGLNGAVEVVQRLERAGITVIVIGGNHDEAGSPGRFNALHLLRRHGIRLFLEQAHVDVSGVRLHLMPFQVLARFLRGRGELSPFEFSDDLPNVLVAHGYLPAPGMPSPPEEVLLPQDWANDRFDLLCLGHVHRMMKVEGYPAAFYGGSPERRDFGERTEEPGFWVHEFQDGKLVQPSEAVRISDLGVPLTPRPMVQHELDARGLSTDDLSKQVMELVSANEAREAMMRVVLTNVSAELDRSRARAQWLRAFKAAGGFYLDVVSQTRRVVEMLDVEFTAPPVNIAESFQEFLATQQYANDEDRQEVARIGSEVMAVAHEKLLAQEAD